MNPNPAATAMKRLHRDLFELAREPVCGCTVQPLEDNMREWHGNFYGVGSKPESCMHFCMLFPESYPLSPPQVYVSAGLPHPNIERCSRHPCGWTVCLSMLEPRSSASSETEPFMKWSSSYSVRSVLMQMSSFVHGMSMQPTYKPFKQERRGSVQMALQRTSLFKCACGHDHEADHWPPRADVGDGPAIEFALEIDGGHFRRWQEGIFQKLESKPTVISEEQQGKAAPVLKVAAPDNRKPSPPVNTHEPEQAAEAAAEQLWQLVRKGARARKLAASDPGEGGFRGLFSENRFQVLLNDENANPQMSNVKQGKDSHKLRSGAELAQAQLSKAALKNMRRRERRKLQQHEDLKCLTAAVSGPLGVSGQHGSVVAKDAPKQEIKVTSKEKGWKAAGAKPVVLSIAAPTAAQLPPLVDEVIAVKRGWTSPAARSSSSFGKRLNSQVLSLCLEFSGVDSVLKLGLTAKYFNVACENGRFWMQAFQARYLQFNTRAAGMDSWKYAYFMCRHNVPSELQCWVTKKSVFDGTQEEDPMLGVPIVFTKNPKTKQVDYIASTFECLSREGFDGGVRHTVMNTPFTDWMPLYIDEGHFDRSLRHFKRFCLKMSGDANGYAGAAFSPQLAVEVLAKMMKTQIILISDNGVPAVDKALTGLCQCFRLMAACKKKWPSIEQAASKKLSDFIRNESCRTKTETPNLASIIALLYVASSKFQWVHLMGAYVGESLDRSVLWACRDHPELAKDSTCSDADRLSFFFESTKVGLKFALIHAHFLKIIARPCAEDEQSSLRALDVFYGHPAAASKKCFAEAVGRIMAISCWPDYFALAGMKMVPKEIFVSRLKQSFHNSLKKGYHTAGMDFTRVHRSGVSNILLKGQSYSVDPGIRSIKLDQLWRYEGATKFLDASLLGYGFDSELVCTVDYCHMNYFHGTRVISHSGDQMGAAGTNSCRHVIDVEMKKLPESIQYLYIVLSSYAGALLGDIMQPSVNLFDSSEAGNGVQLCTYELEDKDTKKFTSILMCRMVRSAPSAKWEMEAIGDMGFGYASNYPKIHSMIEAHIRLKNKAT